MSTWVRNRIRQQPRVMCSSSRTTPSADFSQLALVRYVVVFAAPSLSLRSRTRSR